MATAIITRLGKEQTSEYKIEGFLQESRDPNIDLHIQQKIIPGMYYVKLAEEHLYRPVSCIKVSFSNMANYPLQLWRHITREEDYLGFMFHNSEGEELCKGRFTYGNYQTNNKGKFNLLYLIAGELQKSPQGSELIGEDNIVFYLSQMLKFDGISLENPLLNIGDPSRINGLKRDYEVRTDYISTDNKQAAEGVATVKIVPKKIFCRHAKS